MNDKDLLLKVIKIYHNREYECIDEMYDMLDTLPENLRIKISIFIEDNVVLEGVASLEYKVRINSSLNFTHEDPEISNSTPDDYRCILCGDSFSSELSIMIHAIEDILKLEYNISTPNIVDLTIGG